MQEAKTGLEALRSRFLEEEGQEGAAAFDRELSRLYPAFGTSRG